MTRKLGRPVSARPALHGVPVASLIPITYCLPAVSVTGLASVASGAAGVTVADASSAPVAAS